MRKKHLHFIWIFAMLFLGVVQMNVFAEEKSGLTKYQIVEFKELALEDSYIYLVDETLPDPEKLTKVMPDSLTAVTEENESINIPVEWYCDEEEYYDATMYTIAFKPEFDADVYTVKEECELPLFYVDLKSREEFAPSLLNVTGVANEDTCYNYFRNTIGLNCAAACGVLGNLYAESHTIDPLEYFAEENAWGICQWRNERLSNLQSRYPNSWKTLGSQLNFLLDELNGLDYLGKKTLNYLKGRADDDNGAVEAALYFAKNFERCDAGTYSTRKIWAVKFHGDRHGDVCNCSESYAGNYICTSNSTLNIRSGHSTSSSVVGSIPSGATVYVSKSDGTWAHVEYNGVSGCASMNYLSKVQEPDPTPTEIRGSEMTSGYDRVLPDGNYIIANAANPQYFLDIEGNTYPAVNGTNVTIYSWKTELDKFDTWTLTYQDGFYRITQNGTGMSLDVLDADTLQEKNVQVWGNNDMSAQKWAISRNGRNGYRIQAKCSGYSLDIAGGTLADGTNVRQYSANDTGAQDWIFIPYKPEQTLAEGRYVLLSDMDRRMELDVEGNTGDIPNETNVEIWSDDAPSQYNSFDVVKGENGYYKLIHAASRKALDLYNAGTDLQNNISLHDQNGNAAQDWAIISEGGDSYVIWSRRSGMVMDVENAKAENGTNVSQSTYTGGANQRWYFVQAEYSVAYNLMGGQNGPEKQTKYYKTDLTLSSAVPQREGYTFKGWNDSENLKGNMYQPGNVYTKDGSLTLYAVWERNYTPLLSVVQDGEKLTATISNMDNVVEYGFVCGKEADVTLEISGRTRVVFTELTKDNTFVYEIPKSRGYTYRAYAKYKDKNGEEAVVYSEPFLDEKV